MTSPFAPSDRDLEMLAERLRRGDAAAKQTAVEELVSLGPHAKPLIPVLTDQVRRGLYVASTHAVDLLTAFRDRDLYDALVVCGVVNGLNIFDKCRLLEASMGDFEDELCTHLYRNWQRSDDPAIREVLKALQKNGSRAALPTLRAIEPELAEAARAPARLPANASVEQLIDARFYNPLERLRLLQEAMSAIEQRAAG